MTKRKGIIFASLERLHERMALGQSRHAAKQAIRADGERAWSVTTGKIHSLSTRGIYQQHVLAFVNWARDSYQIRHLEVLDPRADELATEYLTKQVADGRSPYTVASERSALRMFFGDRRLAESVQVPKRKRTQIRRSRGPTAMDNDFQPNNWQAEIAFLKACGLRRSEALDLCVEEISPDGRWIHVRQGKGGKARDVPVLAGHEQAILSLIQGRAKDARVFPRLPVRLDVHALRRDYAQSLYRQYAPGRDLPKSSRSSGRLIPGSYDKEAVLRVSKALGHTRLDVALNHYLR